jgi:lipoate-protein ligase A
VTGEFTAREEPWRLLCDPPADGAWNMAVDEALLDTCARGIHACPPTLRLYGWSPAAVSLGRGQELLSRPSLAYLWQQGIDLVRRPSGGRAVLHDEERTYAVVGGLRRGPFPGGVLDTYEAVAGALVEALRSLGVDALSVIPDGDPRTSAGQPSCFAVPSVHEITVDGLKLVGSAQVRRRSAFLQHGSILLRADPERTRRALGADDDHSTDLSRIGWNGSDTVALDRALTRAFESRFGARLVPGELTPDERERATRLYSWKYLSTCWTSDGRVGARERRWGPL